MSLAVATCPASLWTHTMFAVVPKLDTPGVSRIDLTHDSYADLSGEPQRWMRISSTSHEGPCQRARHFPASLTDGATDTSSIGWGGLVNAGHGPFRAWGGFPRDWLPRHINRKEMHALYHVLPRFCARHLDTLRRDQALINDDNQSVADAFNLG